MRHWQLVTQTITSSLGLIDSIFNILSLFKSHWEIQKYLHRKLFSLRLPIKGDGVS